MVYYEFTRTSETLVLSVCNQGMVAKNIYQDKRGILMQGFPEAQVCTKYLLAAYFHYYYIKSYKIQKGGLFS